MPRNGSGSYSLPEAAFVPGTTISSSSVNSDLSDIASALTGSIAADGQTPITGALKIVNGTAATPAFTFINDTDTGFYLAGTNQLGFAAGGVQTISLDGTAIGAGGNILLYPAGAIPCPVGSMLDWPGSSAPTGWLLCYGQAISRTTYVGLYTVLGTTYGSGDGSTTFNLPDCRGRIGVGKDNMGGSAASRITTGGCGIDGTTLGAVGGEQTHTLITAELAAHSHGVTDPGHTHNVNNQGNLFGIRNDLNTGSGFTPSTNAISAISVQSNTTGITVDSAGSGTAHNNVQPTLIVNKIIFAGV